MFVNKSNINLLIPLLLSLRTSLYDLPDVARPFTRARGFSSESNFLQGRQRQASEEYLGGLSWSENGRYLLLVTSSPQVSLPDVARPFRHFRRAAYRA